MNVSSQSSATRAGQAPKAEGVGLGELARSLWSPAPEMLEDKFLVYRHFTVFLYGLYTVIGPGLWLWDYVLDPVGAMDTVPFRLGYLSFAAAGYVFFIARNLRFLGIFSTIYLLSVISAFTVLLNRLAGGFTSGIGGYMYFQIMAVLFFQCFSLRWNIFFVVAASLVPHLIAVMGFAPGFQHAQYAVLIWPACVGSLLVQVFSAYLYLRNYTLRAELQRSEEKLRVSGEKYKGLVETSANGIWI